MKINFAFPGAFVLYKRLCSHFHENTTIFVQFVLGALRTSLFIQKLYIINEVFPVNDVN